MISYAARYWLTDESRPIRARVNVSCVLIGSEAAQRFPASHLAGTLNASTLFRHVCDKARIVVLLYYCIVCVKFVGYFNTKMPPKRPASSQASGSKPKRQRKMLTISTKVKLLDMLKEGKSFAAVGRHFDIRESTVRSIKKEEKNIRKTAEVTFNKEAKRVMTTRNTTDKDLTEMTRSASEEYEEEQQQAEDKEAEEVGLRLNGLQPYVTRPKTCKMRC